MAFELGHQCAVNLAIAERQSFDVLTHGQPRKHKRFPDSTTAGQKNRLSLRVDCVLNLCNERIVQRSYLPLLRCSSFSFFHARPSLSFPSRNADIRLGVARQSSSYARPGQAIPQFATHRHTPKLPLLEIDRRTPPSALWKTWGCRAR